MGFYTEGRKSVLSPPKCGTNTVACMALKTFSHPEQRPGPLQYTEVADYIVKVGQLPSEYQWAMIVRNPEDRLVSMINYRCGKHNKLDLETAMDRALSDPGNHLYPPMTFYLTNAPLDVVRLFNFSDMRGFGDWLGYPGDMDIPVENQGPKLWSHEQIKEHRNYKSILSKFEADWDLWSKVRK